jgi:hypothetical protein
MPYHYKPIYFIYKSAKQKMIEQKQRIANNNLKNNIRYNQK